MLRFAILRACYRARKPQNPENTKKYKIPHPGSAPQKYGKIPKKYRKSGPKTAIFRPLLYFFGIFSVFSGGRLGVGDFVFFFFHIFGILGFSGSVAGPQDCKQRSRTPHSRNTNKKSAGVSCIREDNTTYTLALRTLLPLTAFKNARNPKFVQNLSQRLFWGLPVKGTEICKNLSENYSVCVFFFFQIL